MNTESNKQIVIYKDKDGSTALEVNLKEETIWLTQKQMAVLFDKDSDTISLHIKNIYKTRELFEDSTTEYFSVVQKEGNRFVKREIKYYNLDLIISVGYRVNSKRGTQFRIWATNLLKQHLVQGYTINQKRLKEQTDKIIELRKTVNYLSQTAESLALTSDEAQGIIKVISDFTLALEILDGYDYNNLKISHTSKREKYKLSLSDALDFINSLKTKFGNSELFGKLRGASLESSINTIYQTFGKKIFYPSIEEKASHLLYFLIKNHPFVDGNKRIGASLFIYFLARNNILYRSDGSKRIADNALVALCLLIAESKPSDKDIIVKVVINLINKNN
jgi:prophage maintenance system killer protein